MNPSDYRGLIINFEAEKPELDALNVIPGIPIYQGILDHTPVIMAETLRHRGWLYGELLSYRREGDSTSNLEDALLDWDDGKLQPTWLNGRFVLFIQDKASHDWTVITDRLGSAHAYYVGIPEHLCAVGTDLGTLAYLGSHRKLDWHALISFFTFGFFLNDSTYYQDIHVFYPASIYRMNATGYLVQHERYWTWQHDVDTSRSYDETIAEYDALLRQAVQRAARGKTVLPISGGLDSRSIAAMYPQDAKVHTYSYGYTDHSIETRISEKVAAAKGLPFHKHIIQPYLFERIEDVVRALHGSQDVTQARQVSMSRWVSEHGDAILTGLWGDVWCDQMGLANGLPHKTTIEKYTYKKLSRRGHRWLLENVTNTFLEPDVARDYLMNILHQRFAGLEHIADPDFRVKAFKTSQWAFRWSNSSLRGFAMGAAPRIPYYDVDLVNFFCTVPTEFVRDRRLQIDHLRRCVPEMAKITWQETRSDLYTEKFLKLRRYASLAADKLRRKVVGEEKFTRNWEVQFFAPEGRQHLERYLLQSRVGNYINLVPVQNLINEVYFEPTAQNGYAASMLLTFAAWLEAVA